MKYFLIIVLAFISILITALYGEEQLDSNNISYPFPLRIRAIYNIEKQKNKGGISRDDIAVLEENHKRILDKSFKEYLFQIKQAGKSYSVFKGEHCLFSGLYNLNSFMSNFEAACFLAARSNKITFGIHRFDLGDLISDYEQLKLYVCQAENTQEISFPPNFYPSHLFLSSKNRNIFIKGTIIKTTKDSKFSEIIADNAYLFYDIKLRRLYPVCVFSSVDSTVSAKVLDISTGKTAFILLESINGRGHTQTIFEIVIDKTNYIVPAVLIVPVKPKDKKTSFCLLADEIPLYSSEFDALAEKPGCTGAQVFARPEWRQFFASAKKDPKRVEYLLTRFSVSKPTQIHICNWENASQGVLAVMAVEIITGRSWMDYDGANPDIKNYVELAKTTLPRHRQLKKILADPVCRRELQNFFSQGIPWAETTRDTSNTKQNPCRSYEESRRTSPV